MNSLYNHTFYLPSRRTTTEIHINQLKDHRHCAKKLRPALWGAPGDIWEELLRHLDNAIKIIKLRNKLLHTIGLLGFIHTTDFLYTLSLFELRTSEKQRLRTEIASRKMRHDVSNAKSCKLAAYCPNACGVRHCSSSATVAVRIMDAQTTCAKRKYNFHSSKIFTFTSNILFPQR